MPDSSVQIPMYDTAVADILVVDDIPHNLRLLSKILEAQSYNVRCTTSPKMAIQAAKTRQPDLMLLDVKMPEMSGYDLCELLKTDLETKYIPVIFISALDELEDKLKGFEVGGVDYITKPFYEAEILMRVRTQITLQVQKKQLMAQNHQLKDEILKRQQTERSLLISEQRYRNLVELSRDWIWECDANYQLVYSNAQVFPLLGYAPEMVVGQTITSLMEAESATQFLQTMADLSSDRPSTQMEVWLRQSSGTTISVETSGLARFDGGEVQGYQGIARDISNRKQAEHEIRTALLRQKEINEFQSRFVSVISHEFRTPLTVIQSSADILQNIPCTESDREELLARIEAAVRHMTLLVDDVVTVGQAEAGKLKASPVRLDFGEFLQGLLHEFDVLAQPRHRIVFQGSDRPIEMSVDHKLMRQMITNLLSNAMKYSPNGGEITVSLKHHNHQAILEVADCGIGIPEQDQSKLFDCFHRAQNVGTIPGTGIGLFITKECVRLHRGSISVKSQVGAGTTFTIHLPLLLDDEMIDPKDELMA